VLKNWPERRIKVVMITTGQHVGPAGDLGVHAINAAIAKLSLMTAIGGLAPSLTLPILVDLGTDNEELLKSPFYSGLRHKRITGELAAELMHDIIGAVESRFGNKTMICFEDMNYRTCQKLLSQYRCFPHNLLSQHRCFSQSAGQGVVLRNVTSQAEYILLISVVALSCSCASENADYGSPVFRMTTKALQQRCWQRLSQRSLPQVASSTNRRFSSLGVAPTAFRLLRCSRLLWRRTRGE
jgi:hypothetical protein